MANIGPIRLNNNEFHQLIPHLRIDELIVIDVKVDGDWRPLFGINNSQKPAYILCNLCNQNIIPAEFKTHLQLKSHKTALSNVKQFYHPYYTYAKSSEKLAKGYSVPDGELKDGIRKAVDAMNSADYKLQRAKDLAFYLSGDEENEYREIVTQLGLKKDAASPWEIFINVTLTLAEILQLEFSDRKDVWKIMLTTFTPHNLSGNFTCVLCSKNLSGIITVNAHFNGYKHKLEQLGTLGVRLRQRKNLTKNCTFQYGTEYSLVLNDAGKSIFQEEALSIMNQNNKIKKDHGTGTYERFGSLGKLSAAIASKANILAAASQNNSENNKEKDNEEPGLIGVEYVVKFTKIGQSKPMYECCLCEVVFNEASMQFHLIGYNHRLKYFEMHYPVTIKKYKDKIGHIKFNEFMRVMTEVLSKLALAIENYHGRANPLVVSATDFVEKRPNIVAHVYSLPHACETTGPSFERFLRIRDIMDIKQSEDRGQRINISKKDIFARFAIPNTEKIYLNERCYDPKVEGKFRARSPRARTEKYQKETRYRSRSRSPHARDSKLELYNVSDLNHENIWKIYREEVSKAASKVELIFNEYRKNPESYPMYDEEWNRFWNRRKEELIAQGIDHRAYNFQPDWVFFFKERLEQIFGEALHKSQVEVRMRLNIPLDAEEDSQSQILHHNYRKPSSSKPFVPPTILSYPHLELQQNDSKDSQLDLEKSSVKQNEPIVDDRPNVIHVLRLMTALEDQLGSLGGKIMDLLTKSLMLEKNCSGNSNELARKILNANNCALLETAMEKLKGILFAGLLEKNKIPGFNKVIHYTGNLLEHASKMGWRKTTSDNYSDKPDNKELQNLLEVMQSKGADLTAHGQKSLSDTLMELLSNQKKEKLVNSTNDLTEYDNRRDQNFSINRSIDRSSSNANLNANLNSDRFKQNMIPSLMSLVSNNRNIVPQSTSTNIYKNSNTNLSSYGHSDTGGNSNIASGSGRNDYSNMNFNNFKTNYMGTSLNNPQNKNMFGNSNTNNNSSSNNNSDRNISEANYNYGSYGARQSSNMSSNLNMGMNMNRSTDFRCYPFSEGIGNSTGNNMGNNGNNMGNIGNGSGNYPKPQNMQWSNTRSNWQQYPINRGGKNM